MEALNLLNQGRLDEAIDTARELVKSQPTVTEAREVFSEMLCLKGELERADKQLETIVLQQPQQAITAVLMRQLIRAEITRREVWNEGRMPEFVGEPDWICRQTLEALLAYREQKLDQSLQLIEGIQEKRSELSGICDGIEFTGLRDLDDRCLAISEVLTSTGKYFWIPFSQIELIEFSPVVRPRDLMWRQCQMRVRNGPDGVVYIPVRYHGSDVSGDVSAQLGRKTDWLVEDGSPISGLGQRVFEVGDRELGIMEIVQLEIRALE